MMNVNDVMEKVILRKRREVWRILLRKKQFNMIIRRISRIDPIHDYIDEIYSSHSSDKEKTHTCSDTYVNCCPESSWEHLTSMLYEEGEMTAVDQARPFLPPRGM